MRGFRLALIVALAVPRLRPIGAAAALFASAWVVLPVAGMALAVLPAGTLALAPLLRLSALVRLTTLVALIRFTALLVAALLLRPAAEIIALAIAFAAFVVAFEARTEAGAVGGVSRLPALRAELLLRRHDDAVVMLGVLKITLRADEIARRHRITRERSIFLGDMRCCAADFYVRTVRFEAAREWVLGLTATTAASPTIILLSLPHRPVFNPNKRSMPRSFFSL
jgi:hypothetical protein